MRLWRVILETRPRLSPGQPGERLLEAAGQFEPALLAHSSLCAVPSANYCPATLGKITNSIRRLRSRPGADELENKGEPPPRPATLS